ncbi:hypothetical protein FRB93_005897 [Tulasnella sp. JGI-2019a]|nr:hypothetical protein FRB93_005897 [Tulasnella sp. JGI-2019a]
MPPHNPKGQVLRVARLFSGLRKAGAELKRYCQHFTEYIKSDAALNLEDTGRFFSYHNPCDTNQGQRTLFFTEHFKSDKLIWRAQEEESRASANLIVKFVKTYNIGGHEGLAKRGLAPKLLGVSNPDDAGWYMVMMEFVDCVDWEGITDKLKAVEEIMEDAEAAITHLHENGQVFGDLQAPNVLIRRADKDSNRIVQAMLVDFDWNGNTESMRYCIDINMTSSDLMM